MRAWGDLSQRQLHDGGAHDHDDHLRLQHNHDDDGDSWLRWQVQVGLAPERRRILRLGQRRESMFAIVPV